MRQLSYIYAALLLASPPSWAVYRCQDLQGRTSFQERPCSATGSRGGPIDATPATGRPAPDLQPSTELQRLRASTDRLRQQNRLATIDHLEMPGARGRLNRSIQRCDSGMAQLRAQKNLAANNLAGATWEQAISQEMQALATQCGAEQQRLPAELDRLIAEQAELTRQLGQ